MSYLLELSTGLNRAYMYIKMFILLVVKWQHSGKRRQS